MRHKNAEIFDSWQIHGEVFTAEYNVIRLLLVCFILTQHPITHIEQIFSSSFY